MTKPISTPYDGRRWWDSNLRTPACKSPTLPLCYGRRSLFQIGTEDEPYPDDVTMTMFGSPTTKELPIYGTKGIFIREGTLDIHGNYVLFLLLCKDTSVSW